MVDQPNPNVSPVQTPSPDPNAPPASTRFNDEQVKQIGDIVNTSIQNAQQPPEEDSNLDGSGDYYSNLEPNGNQVNQPPSQGYDPAQGQAQEQGQGYDPNAQYYQENQPPAENPQSSKRIDDIEAVTKNNYDDISYMRFKSDLSDKIMEDETLRPYYKEAISTYSKYAKTGQNINADTILNLMEGESTRKKRLEERALNNSNTGDTGLNPTGAAPKKHPMDMTVEEIEEQFGQVKM